MKKLAWDSKAYSAERPKGYLRPRSDSPYHTWRWTKVSRAFRERHPLCAECFRHGILKAAEVTDHIVPWPVCGDFWDSTNYQALCADCNAAKGNRDKRLIEDWRRTHPGAQEGRGA